MSMRTAPAFTFVTTETTAVPAPTLTEVLRLFHTSYQNANDDYFRRSLGRLRFLSTATCGDTLAGFALGEMRLIDLPRLPQQAVALAGMCCIDPGYRRHGLFRELEVRAFRAAAIAPGHRLLSCGRVAHPASFRTMTANPTHVPKRGCRPTAWQQAIGATIAAAYGVAAFDPETFVCRGAGVPIGYPVMELDVPDTEWEVFRAVDRDRGDSLLGLCWWPDAPDGW